MLCPYCLRKIRGIHLLCTICCKPVCEECEPKHRAEDHDPAYVAIIKYVDEELTEENLLRNQEEKMNIGKAFPSNYLKNTDFTGKRAVMTIESVVIENIGDEDKPVAYFSESKLGLVLNKTNANMIAEIAKSEETDNWIGVKIILYSTKVDFQGRRVDAIRVDVPAASDHSAESNGNGKPGLGDGPVNHVAQLGAAILAHTKDDKVKALEILKIVTGKDSLRDVTQADAQKGYEAFKFQYVDDIPF